MPGQRQELGGALNVTSGLDERENEGERKKENVTQKEGRRTRRAMDWVSWAEVKGEEGVYRGQVPVFIKPRRSAVQFLSSAALISGCAPDGHLPFVEFFALHVSQRAIRQIWIWVKRPGGILASTRSKKTPLALVSVLAKIEALVFSQPYSSTGVQNYKPRRWGGELHCLLCTAAPS